MMEVSGWISVEEARRQIVAGVCAAGAVREVQTVAVEDALLRVCAQDVVAPFHVPAHDNSAMDGYACLLADVCAGVRTLKVAGASFAGHPFAGAVAAGQCVKIMTGARLPENTELVVPQEETTAAENTDDGMSQIAINASDRRKRGQHLRAAGEDIKQGAVALPRGQVCYPAEIGLLASLGLTEVAVLRRLRVGFFSTGDEIRQAGEALGASDVYDSNRHTLRAMVARAGFAGIDGGIVRDDRAALASAVDAMAAQADVIITSGGASVGEADYIRAVLRERGEVQFWKVAMRPGRPLTFGSVRGVPFFGLPGNPVSVMVCFYQFVLPALWLRAGQAPAACPPPLPQATTRTALRKVAGRSEYQRGYFSQTEDGQYEVESTGDQGSGILSSMTRANCFIVLDAETTRVPAGATVAIQPFIGLV